jgi:hypothetical protein
MRNRPVSHRFAPSSGPAVSRGRGTALLTGSRASPALCIALLAALAGCTQDPAPTTTAEAQFTVNPGAGDRQFNSVLITAGNASHQIDTPLQAPYMIFVENATPPVQGIFVPNTPTSLADVELLFGGETVPRICNPDQSPSTCCAAPEGALCVNSGAAPSPVPVDPEVRFDVTSVPVSFFTGDVGSINQDHLISPAQAPASIYLEGPQENAQGVFTKQDPDAALTVTLYVNGVVVDSDTSPAGSSNDAIVQFQFD